MTARVTGSGTESFAIDNEIPWPDILVRQVYTENISRREASHAT